MLRPSVALFDARRAANRPCARSLDDSDHRPLATREDLVAALADGIHAQDALLPADRPAFLTGLRRLAPARRRARDRGAVGHDVLDEAERVLKNVPDQVRDRQAEACCVLADLVVERLRDPG